MALLKLSAVPTGRNQVVADAHFAPTPGRGSLSVKALQLLGVSLTDEKPTISLFFNEDATGLENLIYITKGFGDDVLAISPNKDAAGRVASYGYNSANLWNRLIQYYKESKDIVILEPISQLEMINKGLAIAEGKSYSATCAIDASIVRAIETDEDGVEQEASVEFEGEIVPVFAMQNFLFAAHTRRNIKADSTSKEVGALLSPADQIVDEQETGETSDQNLDDELEAIQ